MEKNRFALMTLIASLLMMGLATAAVADSDSDSDSDRGRSTIVGSWEATSSLEPSGEVAPGFFTFNRDRTWVASTNDAAFGNAHGAWKRTGRRTFLGTNKGFAYGPDGMAALVVTNRVEITVAADGNGFTAVFEGDVSLLDGTIIDSFTGSATGTRIEVEPF